MARSSNRVRQLPLAVLAAGVAAVVVGPFRPASAADVIRLTDGTRYEGDIKRQGDGYVVTFPDGRQTHVALDKVAGLEARAKSSEGVQEQRLASLRRAVETAPDAKQVVDRYRAFVQQCPDPAVAAQAAADLHVWQDRVDGRMVKVGDRWVADDERQRLAEQSFRTAGRALDLLRESRANEAAPVVEQALAENAQNPAAHYLRGLLLWRQEKVPDARRAFEQAVALAPDHAAAHNNLAVVLWRQKQHVAALLSYDKALSADPADRLALDNLAEALFALPEELRERTAVAKVVRHFNDHERVAKERMAARGLFRWGSSWVPRAEHDKLRAVERDVRERVDAMETQFATAGDRMRQLAGDIESAERTLRRMEADSYRVDPATGRLVRYPLPPSYHEFVRDVGAMKAERAQRSAEQEGLRRQARQLVQSLPTARYAGVQRMADPDRAPVIGRPAEPLPAPGMNPAPAPVPPPPQPPAPAEPPAATRPAMPPLVEVGPAGRRPAVPPEKPSILDRRLSEPAPPEGDPPPGQ